MVHCGGLRLGKSRLANKCEGTPTVLIVVSEIRVLWDLDYSICGQASARFTVHKSGGGGGEMRGDNLVSGLL